jgi:flagellar M-ring protein FliF
LGAGSLEQELMRRRSIEQHLACTIGQMEGVERAQVHLTLPEQNAFRRLSRPAKASVMLWPRRGARLNGDLVHGITLLVSSAVETLEPEQVAVVNARGGTLVSPSQENSVTSQSTRELAVRQEVEGHLARKAEAMLAPLLTPGEFQVQVSADLDFTVIERTSELWDPETQAIVREEAAEVPPGATGVGSPSYNSEERESRFSRTLENLSNAPGSIQRLSVAVVVNERAEMFTGGNAARTQLGTIEAIVRNAVGLDSARGDQLIVTAIPFLALDDSLMVGSGASESDGIDPLVLAERFARPVVGLIGIIVTMIVVLRLLKTLKGTGGGRSLSSGPTTSPSRGQPAMAAKPEPPKLDTSSHLAQQVLHETQQSPEMAARVVRAWLSESPS